MNLQRLILIRAARSINIAIVLFWASSSISAENCEAVLQIAGEPSAKRFGDIEITADPEDPLDNLLFVVNIGEDQENGAKIFVAQLDRLTGLLTEEEPSLIAKNYVGERVINGPEFAYHPDYGTGVLFAGPYGVHGAWRKRESLSWDAFDSDLYGFPFPKNNPPPLPGTTPLNYPKGSPPFGTTTFIEWPGATGEKKAGNYADLTYTPLNRAIEDLGYEADYTQLHPGEDGYIVFSGCSLPRSETSNCGIFEVQIDGAGGLIPDTFLKLTPSNSVAAYSSTDKLKIEAGIHPATREFVVFAKQEGKLDIWVADSVHSPASRFGTLNNLPRDASHFMQTSGANELLVHFIVRAGIRRGSYLISYDGATVTWRKISQASAGSELVYFPANNRLALYYKKPNPTKTRTTLFRCWVE